MAIATDIIIRVELVLLLVDGQIGLMAAELIHLRLSLLGLLLVATGHIALLEGSWVGIAVDHAIYFVGVGANLVGGAKVSTAVDTLSVASMHVGGHSSAELLRVDHVVISASKDINVGFATWGCVYFNGRVGAILTHVVL